MGFGDFTAVCRQASLPLCTLVGTGDGVPGVHGILAKCYSRTIDVANTMIFQGTTGIAHICALIMTVIMIVHVRGKFTAVGRKEITTFFYFYFLLTIFSLLLDCGVVPPGSGAYPWFVAVQNAFTSATCICLMINGFVGFQLYEDGTTLSVWLLRLCTLGMGAVSFIVSILTLKSWGGLGPTNTVGLFVVLYIFSAVFLFVYVVMQVILVVGTLQDRWPLGHIAFGVFFFVMGQILLYPLNTTVCEGIKHYMDGVFFATVCNLFAVMMVYKFWDSITKEDLEFSVGARQNQWDIKEPLSMYMDEDTSYITPTKQRNTVYQDSTYADSTFYQQPMRVSHSHNSSRS